MAVIALAEPEWMTPIERTMESWDGQIVRHGFSAKEWEEIEEAVDAEAVAGTSEAAAGDQAQPGQAGA